MLWNANDAATATGGQTTGNWQASGLSIDTRSLMPGDMFVALTDQRDGHDFVAEAFEKGAAVALVSRVPDGVPANAPLLVVPEVLGALRDMAAAARARTDAKIIGVTGSVGKTGTKEMLRTALSPQGKVHAAERSFNNHWGVPLTLARMPKDTDFAVIEIGMNHPGEITPLARLSRLDVAIVTSVAAVHMAAFKDVEEIAKAKAEIFSGLKPGGTAVLNAEIETLPVLQKAARAVKAQQILFGKSSGADLRLEVARIHGALTNIRVQWGSEPMVFRLGAPGEHLAMNALAVLAAVRAVGGDVAQAMLALSDWHAPQGRGSRFIVPLAQLAGLSVEVIDESYNANPTSLAAALVVLAASNPVDGVGSIRKGRRIAILGDMLELGADERQIHAGLADMEELTNIDTVHTVGPLMQSLHNALAFDKRGEWCETAEEFCSKIARLFDAGDVIMIKGSNGSKVSRIVGAIRKLGLGDLKPQDGGN